MRLNFFKYSISSDFLLLLVFILAGLFNKYIYVIFEQAHLIRLLIPVAILFIVKKRIYLLDTLGLSAILFYVVFFVFTTLSSIFYWSEINIKDYFNFAVVTFLALTFILIGYNNPKVYLKVLFTAALIFFVCSFVVAVHEVIRLEHLRYSKVYGLDPNEWWHHYPTAFQFNPNDFASTVMLTVLFIIAYIRVFKPESAKWKELIFLIIAGWLAYETHSRLIQATFFISLLVYYWQYLLRIKIILILATFTVIFVYFFSDHIDRILVVMNLGDNDPDHILNSTDVRLNLYKYGFKSIIDSFGIGFGCFNYDYYYKSLNIYPQAFGGIYFPHLYFTEVLLNGGIIPLFFWILMYAVLIREAFLHTKEKEIRLFVFIYPILLAASSSCLFNYSFYIFFVGFIVLIRYKKMHS